MLLRNIVQVAVMAGTTMGSVLPRIVVPGPTTQTGIVGIGTVDGTGLMVGSSYREKPQIRRTTRPHPWCHHTQVT